VLLIVIQTSIFYPDTSQCSNLVPMPLNDDQRLPAAPFRDGGSMFLRNIRMWATYMSKGRWNAQDNNLDELVLSARNNYCYKYVRDNGSDKYTLLRKCH
jgi:hypothetical protein